MASNFRAFVVVKDRRNNSFDMQRNSSRAEAFSSKLTYVSR